MFSDVSLLIEDSATACQEIEQWLAQAKLEARLSAVDFSWEVYVDASVWGYGAAANT